MGVKGIRTLASMAGSIKEPALARIVNQLEERIHDVRAHGHDAFSRLADGHVPAPGGTTPGRVLHETGDWRPSPLVNSNTAQETANGAEAYLAGSALLIPSGIRVPTGAIFRWRLGMTKTAAGVAQPVWTVRVGTTASLSDQGQIAFTSPFAQTAASDSGGVEITATLWTAGASAQMAGVLSFSHVLAATGFATVQAFSLPTTSSTFDATIDGLYFGVSVHPGASGVWAHQLITGEALNL